MPRWPWITGRFDILPILKMLLGSVKVRDALSWRGSLAFPFLQLIINTFSCPSDLATKYLATADKYSLPRIVQFSSEDRLTKYEICEVFAKIMGVPLDGM